MQLSLWQPKTLNWISFIHLFIYSFMDFIYLLVSNSLLSAWFLPHPSIVKCMVYLSQGLKE